MSKHLVAGATSGFISASLLQPLDLLKTRLQQQPRATPVTSIVSNIVNKEGGIPALWRGASPTILRNVPGVALYFYVLQGMRGSMASMPAFAAKPPKNRENLSVLPKLSSQGNLLAGAVARVGVGFVLNPFTLLKARFESDMYSQRTMWQSLRDVVRTYGGRGLLQGFTASALRDAPYSGIFVLSYELIKHEMALLPNLNGPTALALSGAAAAGISTLVTQPFDVAKTNMQLQPKVYTSIWTTFTSLARERGVRSYFDGLSFRIVKKGASSAISWAVYEMLLKYMMVP